MNKIIIIISFICFIPISFANQMPPSLDFTNPFVTPFGTTQIEYGEQWYIVFQGTISGNIWSEELQRWNQATLNLNNQRIFIFNTTLELDSPATQIRFGNMFNSIAITSIHSNATLTGEGGIWVHIDNNFFFTKNDIAFENIHLLPQTEFLNGKLQREGQDKPNESNQESTVQTTTEKFWISINDHLTNNNLRTALIYNCEFSCLLKHAKYAGECVSGENYILDQNIRYSFGLWGNKNSPGNVINFKNTVVAITGWNWIYRELPMCYDTRINQRQDTDRTDIVMGCLCQREITTTTANEEVLKESPELIEKVWLAVNQGEFNLRKGRDIRRLESCDTACENRAGGFYAEQCASGINQVNFEESEFEVLRTHQNIKYTFGTFGNKNMPGNSIGRNNIRLNTMGWMGITTVPTCLDSTINQQAGSTRQTRTPNVSHDIPIACLCGREI